jgi:small-conductance mechanosensitive channel
MRTISDWGEAFLTASSDALSKLFGFLPDLLGALVILWIGWIIAGALSKLVTNLLRKLRFNEATEKAGLNRFLGQAGIRKDASSLMGEIVKWFFRLIALVAAFSVLQLPALTAALTGILNFIPNLFIGLVIILVGSLIAGFIGDLVKGAASTAGFDNANVVSNLARYAILYIALIAALGQLGVAATVINTLFIGTVAALAIAFGLAFGLGGRDTVAKIWENTYHSAQKNLPKLNQGLKQQAKQSVSGTNQKGQLKGSGVYNTPPTPTTDQSYSQPGDNL